LTVHTFGASASAFVVDDDMANAEMLVYKLEDLEFHAQVAPEMAVSHLAQATSFLVKQRPAAVVCDHRLRDGGFDYDGAALVAGLNRSGIPAVLVTQYLDQDMHTSIRRFRRHIPVVLARDAVSSQTLASGLMRVQREIAGDVDLSRRPHHVLLEVEHVDNQSGEQVIDVTIDSWRPGHAVRLPAALVPGPYRTALRRYAFLYAQVNIGAEEAEDLFIDDIEWGGFLEGEDGDA